MGEDIESVRPAYDYAKTQARLEELEGAIRRLKHAINCFNTTQVVDGFGITIDEMLVYGVITKSTSAVMKHIFTTSALSTVLFGISSALVCPS